MELKFGVKVAGVKPEIIVAMIVVDSVFQEHGAACVVTSCVEGKHGANSLHPKGYAIDVRSSVLSAIEQVSVRDDLKRRLGPDYDVILEIDHYHLEYDPKPEVA